MKQREQIQQDFLAKFEDFNTHETERPKRSKLYLSITNQEDRCISQRIKDDSKKWKRLTRGRRDEERKQEEDWSKNLKKHRLRWGHLFSTTDLWVKRRRRRRLCNKLFLLLIDDLGETNVYNLNFHLYSVTPELTSALCAAFIFISI